MQSSSISQQDWSLHREGQIDQERHKQKSREAIKKNLADIVSEESIILSDGKK
ncbi:MAG: sporulation protein YhbH, partial [Ktedonobacterales bacterium]